VDLVSESQKAADAIILNMQTLAETLPEYAVLRSMAGVGDRLFKGRYSPQRVFQTALNLLLLLFMIAQPLCGILMSKHLFAFLPTDGLSSVARAIHLPLSNWGFVLMSLHAGTHLGAMLPKGRKKAAVLGCLGVVSLYGVYAFLKRQIPAYLFLRLPFAFFDYSEPRLFFFADYLAVIVLFALVGYGLMNCLKRKQYRN